MGKVFKIILRVFHVILATVVAVVIVFAISLKLITGNTSESAKSLFVTTVLETGQMKFLAKVYLSEAEIQKIVDKNSMKDFDVIEDLDLIKVQDDDKDSIELVKIKGKSFAAKMLIIKDPSRVMLSTIYPWREYGVVLDKLVESKNAIAGTNAGMYNSDLNKGGRPQGVVVCGGEIQYIHPQAGIVLIGFNEDNLLRVIDLSGKSRAEIENIIETEKIRDAVTFLEETSDKDNHFVKLIINGVEREIDGRGSGANPRTVIGQRKDGAILLLVTDGRGKDGHLGATARDLIKIMKKYGAVNAANLDGGSSSSMYYDGVYEMPSVTLYYSNSSWNLPTAWVVEKR